MRKEYARKVRRTLSASSSNDDDSSAMSEVGPANTESLRNAFEEQGRALQHSRLTPRQLKREKQKAEQAKRVKEQEAARLRQEEIARENQRREQERLAAQAEAQRQRQAEERQRQEAARQRQEEEKRAQEAEQARRLKEMRASVPYGWGMAPLADKTKDPGAHRYWDPNSNEPRNLPHATLRYNWPRENQEPPPGHFWDLDAANTARRLPPGYGAGVYWPWAAPTLLRPRNEGQQPQVNHYFHGDRGPERPIPNGYGRMNDHPWSLYPLQS